MREQAAAAFAPAAAVALPLVSPRDRRLRRSSSLSPALPAGSSTSSLTTLTLRPSSSSARCATWTGRECDQSFPCCPSCRRCAPLAGPTRASTACQLPRLPAVYPWLEPGEDAELAVRLRGPRFAPLVMAHGRAAQPCLPLPPSVQAYLACARALTELACGLACPCMSHALTPAGKPRTCRPASTAAAWSSSPAWARAGSSHRRSARRWCPRAPRRSS